MTNKFIKLLIAAFWLTAPIYSSGNSCRADLGKPVLLAANSEATTENSKESIFSGTSEHGNSFRTDAATFNESEHWSQSNSEANNESSKESQNDFLRSNPYPAPNGMPSGVPAYMRRKEGSDYVKSLPQQSDYVKSDNIQSSDYVKGLPEQSDYVKGNTSSQSNYVTNDKQPSDYATSKYAPPAEAPPAGADAAKGDFQVSDYVKNYFPDNRARTSRLSGQSPHSTATSRFFSSQPGQSR